MMWFTRAICGPLTMIFLLAALIVASQQFQWAQGQQGMATRGARPMPRLPRSHKTFPVSFVDVALSAGLTTPIIHGSEKSKKYIIESMGSGAAFFDYDNDGFLDIFLVNGSRLENIPDASEPTNLLYRNNGDSTFTDITERAGLSRRSGWGQGISVGDYDNDGFADLFVTYWGSNVLYKNNGDGGFSDVTEEAGLTKDVRWGSGSAFFDYDRDGYLDIFVATYLELDLAKVPTPSSKSGCSWHGLPVVCGPRGLPFSRNILYRNNGDGTFTDVSEPSGLGEAKQTYALGVVAADLDGDGWPDLYVAGDSTRSLFYRNNHDGTFSEIGIPAGVAYDVNGMEQSGMGVALGDYDRDGLLDIAKTNFAEDYPNLYRNIGDGAFEDVAPAAGLGVNPQYVLWNVAFADFDNSGWQDLFIAAGHVYPEIDQLKTVQSYKNPRLIYWNLANGRFEDVSDRSGPGILAKHSSRGGAIGDFDNDGDLDVLVVNMNEPPSLLRNENRSGNNWLKVKVIGTKSNRSAIGAKVSVAGADGGQQTNVVLSQSGYLSHNDPRLHFGLGKAAKVDFVEVSWPSGLVETIDNPEVNQLLRVVEGSTH